MTGEDVQHFGQGVDPHAELFARGDAFYRAIRPEHADFYRELLQRPLIQQLMTEGLIVRSKIASTDGTDNRLVIEHERVWPISYPFEWTPGMFQQAALAFLRLVKRLMADGLCIQDGHLWNFVFDGTAPRFVDFSSIIKLPEDGRWPRFGAYEKFCANPMRLMAGGYVSLARSLMRSQLEPIDRLLPDSIFQHPRRRLAISHKRRFRAAWSVIRWGVELLDLAKHVCGIVALRLRGRKGNLNRFPERASLADVEREIARVESLDLLPPIAQWSEYYTGKNKLPVYDGTLASIDSLRKATPKHECVTEAIARWKPKSVLDLGCNRGLYSQFAALEGARVVGADLDEAALEMMYRDSRKLGTRVTPLALNPCMPIEAHGRVFRPFPTVIERIRSEAVFCLALTHHMVHGRMRMNFDEIALLLSKYAERYVLVEFIAKEDKHVMSSFGSSPDWYHLDNFRAAFARYFPQIEVRPSHWEHRHLLLCERPGQPA